VTRRLFWIAVGVVVTVVAYQQGRKLYRRYVPASVADKAEQVVQDAAKRTHSAVAEFRAEFADARERREKELMAALLADGQDSAVQHGSETAGVRPGFARRSERGYTDFADDDTDEAELGYSF
jgi:hypothetical protein